MMLNRIVAIVLAAGLLVFSPMAVFAQGETAQEATAAQPDPTRNWRKICEPLEDGRSACVMSQTVLANNQFLGSFALRDDPSQESRLMALVAVPVGVLLPMGLTRQIDNGEVYRMPYLLCDPQTCQVSFVVNEAFVNSLKKGAYLKLVAKNPRNEDIVVQVNLAGFTAVYDSDPSTAMTVQQLQEQTTGAAAIERPLQDLAERLRRQLDQEAAADGETPPAQ